MRHAFTLEHAFRHFGVRNRNERIQLRLIPNAFSTLTRNHQSAGTDVQS